MAPRKNKAIKSEPGSRDELPHNMGAIAKSAATQESKSNTKNSTEKSSPQPPEVEEPSTTPEATPVVALKKKAHKYKLDYEKSLFPNHPLPTPEAAQEVYRLLAKEHGESKAPTKVPPPSVTQSGCGEVPDLLDALLRTVLSANTSGKNSGMALKGLLAAFGAVNGSPDWHAASRAKAEDITKAIHRGGLSVIKGKRIKEILNIVRDQNIERRDALLEEKATGKPADVLATSHLTPVQKDAEIARIKENPLTMDWIFEIKKDSDVLDELIKLPGIGMKTASCGLLFNMQRPSFAVDTHVHRHCKWLGWVPPNATADQTFNHCDLRIPADLKYGLHVLFIKHGKACYKCRANTNPGSADWKASKACPIEHLVNRDLTRKPRKKRKLEDSEISEGDAEDSGDSDVKPSKSARGKAKVAKTTRAKPEIKEERVLTSRPKRAARGKKSPIKDESSESEMDEEVSEYDG
ncbi:putative DNA glycosylase [Lachnellula suecica]|uniref:Putative DNA glycosylase n=1 Tax=Lachnellula suecica TaxID=602035 RepID=A0A8T9C8I2_9HELO|nr:putative DNA glycosylase [Lachnellula suecica]